MQAMTAQSSKAASRVSRSSSRSKNASVTLAIDIGGSHLKVMLLAPAGHPLSERARVVTPAIPPPRAVLKVCHTAK